MTFLEPTSERVSRLRVSREEPDKDLLQTLTIDLPEGLQSHDMPLQAAWKSAALVGVELYLSQANLPLTSRLTLLRKLALSIRNADPQGALQLVDVMLNWSSDYLPALMLGASVRSRIGDKVQASALASRVLAHPGVNAGQVVYAAGLLSRDNLTLEVLTTAKAAFERFGRALSLFDTMLDMALRAADWDYVDTLLEQLAQERASGHPDALKRSARNHLLWCDNEQENIQVTAFSVAKAMSATRPLPPPSLTSLTGRRLRVGYLSSDFRDHPTSRLLLGLLRHHNLQRIDLFLYCSGWDDGSAIRKAIVQAVGQFRSVSALSDEQAAKLIRSDEIDVLVELNGPTHAHRMGILSYRPAAVQIDYLGWPGSVGGHGVDYVVGDAYTIPAGRESIYPEKIIRLHQVYQVNDFAAATLMPPPSRHVFGLPENALVLGMFNNINKVRNEVWQVWMRIMRAVPNAVLWVLEGGGELVGEHIRAATVAAGIDESRLFFAPRCAQSQHLSRLQLCDLMLDPWPYGGHTSTSDALFARVPVIALAGNNFAGRVSGALLHAAGLGCLVAVDKADYVAKSVRILTDVALRDDLRRFLREQVPRSDVFNARDKARQFEAAFRKAYELVLAGKPPEHMNLQPRHPKPQANFCWPDDRLQQVDDRVFGEWFFVPESSAVRFRYLGTQRPKSEGLVCFCTIRNEAYFILHFLAHYRALGVSSFVFLDDYSEDGSRELLLAQSDCCVLESTARYGDQIDGKPFHLCVKQWLPRFLCDQRWVLTVDADEFLLLPNGFEQLSVYCDYLDEHNLNHTRAVMLDFFPERLNDISALPVHTSPWQACPYVEPLSVVDWPAGAVQPRRMSVLEGVRARLYTQLMVAKPELKQEFVGYQFANLNKVPLLKWQTGVEVTSSHRVNQPIDDEHQLVLAHFKFYPGWLEKTRVLVDEAQHWQGAIEYRFLLAAAEYLAHWSLITPRTLRFKNPSQLVDAGLLFAKNNIKKLDQEDAFARTIPLVLVCGPWSSGSSAVAGLLANAGLQSLGPYVGVNDPKTPMTYEMLAFQKLLKTLASEQDLTRVDAVSALLALRRFRDEVIMPQIRLGSHEPALMLKHGLVMLFLPELSQLFDLRIVGVLRPLVDIEATRVRRGWQPMLGQKGASLLYQRMFDFLVNHDTPFHLVRYPELLSNPSKAFEALMNFCGHQPTAAQRQAAIAFVTR